MYISSFIRHTGLSSPMVPVVQTCGEMLLVNINIIKYICKEYVDLKNLEERKRK